ncbi:MAG: ABC transporter permease [Pirellulaceae bacterium]
MFARRDLFPKYGVAFCLASLSLAAAVTWLTADEPARRLLANTFQLCGSVAATSLPVGVVLAMLLTRTNVAGKRFAWLLLVTLLFLPLHSTAAGWVSVLGKLGSQAPALYQTAQPLVDGMAAVIWIHAMAAIPWVSLIVSLGLAAIPREVEEAAILDISPTRFFLGVGLRYYLPFVLAAALWAVITTAGEMTVTNLYMVSTYAEALYNNFALTPDAPIAGLRLLPGICGTILMVVAICGMIVSLSPAGLGRQFQTSRSYELGKWRWPLTLLGWCLLLLVFGVPLASLVLKAGMVKYAVGSTYERTWSPAAFFNIIVTTPRRFSAELGVSALYAAWGAAVALFVGLPLAILARPGGERSWPAIIAAAVCWAIPGPLVGLSLTWLLNWNFAPLIFLMDKTPLAPALALGIKALPITILVLWSALASIPRQTLEAARLDGAGELSLFWRIMLPQRAAAIAAAAVIAFAIGMADLSWSLLVLPTDTLQRRVFGLIHAGVDEQVAGISLVTLALYFVLALGIQALMRHRSPARKPT